MYFPTAIILALVASVNAVTHYIQVGDLKGDTVYTPPEIVSAPCTVCA